MIEQQCSDWSRAPLAAVNAAVGVLLALRRSNGSRLHQELGDTLACGREVQGGLLFSP